MKRISKLPIHALKGSRHFGRVRCLSTGKVDCVLGSQWGDEGKGKLVDILAEKADIVCRFNGGANAGHTLVVDGKKFAFHLLPCGLLYPHAMNVIGNGCVVNIQGMFQELKNLDEGGIDYKGRLFVSNRAQLLFDFHKAVDGILEDRRGDSNIGTTKKGIGPCYASKATRNGIRVGELLDWDAFKKRYEALASFHEQAYDFTHDKVAELEAIEALRESVLPMVCDTVTYINQQMQSGKHVLAEGANACLLDLDYGTYPMVTSSPTSIGGICTGMGISTKKVGKVFGVVKAYTTRVGSGPFPTELKNEIGERIQNVGAEFGVTTGRKRRCGWLDVALLRYSHMLNGYDSLNITKLDVLSGMDELKIGVEYSIDGCKLPHGAMPSTLDELAKVEVEYVTLPGWSEDISKITCMEDLPENAKNYVKVVEDLLGLPVSWVGVGPARNSMLEHHMVAYNSA